MSVVVAGEALVDLRPDRNDGRSPHPGGSPANVAVALGRLGRPVRLLTALGEDRYGGLVRAHLADSNVDVDAAVVPRTSTALVTLGADGTAAYELDLLVDLPDVEGSKVPQWLHVGSLAALRPPAADKVLDLVRAWRSLAAVSYDPNLRREPTSQERTRIVELVSLSQVVKLSDDDAALFEPGTHPEALVRSWLGLGPEVVIVTRGARGAVGIARGSGRVAVPAGAGGPVVDTIGAGDAFTAGLIHVLHDGDDLAAALELASAVARRTCEKPGADPPWREIHR